MDNFDKFFFGCLAVAAFVGMVLFLMHTTEGASAAINNKQTLQTIQDHQCAPPPGQAQSKHRAAGKRKP